MDHAQLQTMVMAAGLGSQASDLIALAKPSIRLTTKSVDETSLTVGASKFGGTPDLPLGTAWPIWQGVAMSFVGQIRLEDVVALDTEHALPTTGLLTFFYDARQQTFGDSPSNRGGWQVLYTESSTSAQRSAAPVNLPAAARFKPCALTFSSDLTLPIQPQLERPGLALSADAEAKYETLLATYPSKEDHAATHHRLLGHPDTIQDDMRVECQLAANGATDASDPKAAALIPDALKWVLLLQVDSDDHTGMRWGSAGMLYFWIEREALAARKFDNVWVVLQSD